MLGEHILYSEGVGKIVEIGGDGEIELAGLKLALGKSAAQGTRFNAESRRLDLCPSNKGPNRPSLKISGGSDDHSSTEVGQVQGFTRIVKFLRHRQQGAHLRQERVHPGRRHETPLAADKQGIGKLLPQ